MSRFFDQLWRQPGARKRHINLTHKIATTMIIAAVIILILIMLL